MVVVGISILSGSGGVSKLGCWCARITNLGAVYLELVCTRTFTASKYDDSGPLFNLKWSASPLSNTGNVLFHGFEKSVACPGLTALGGATT